MGILVESLASTLKTLSDGTNSHTSVEKILLNRRLGIYCTSYCSHLSAASKRSLGGLIKIKEAEQSFQTSSPDPLKWFFGKAERASGTIEGETFYSAKRTFRELIHFARRMEADALVGAAGILPDLISQPEVREAQIARSSLPRVPLLSDACREIGRSSGRAAAATRPFPSADKAIITINPEGFATTRPQPHDTLLSLFGKLLLPEQAED